MTRLLTLALLLAAPLGAQSLRPGLLVGRVLDAGGEPVAEAVIRASQGVRTIIAEADDEGDFRLGGLSAGHWVVTVRRLGYRPAMFEVDMPQGGLRRDLTVERVTPQLDPMLVAARWTGVRGIVGDARKLAPLGGASIQVVGADARTGSDSLGAFAVAIPGGREVLLRVDRAGFAPRLMSVKVPASGYVELDVPLETAAHEARDLWIYRDLDQRLKFATPRSVQVSRDEIASSDATSLGPALAVARSVIEKGIVITRRACVFVNGVARPDYPFDAILAGDVEFVEAYPPGSDLTRTLVMKWPPGATCGAPDGTVGAAPAAAKQVAQFIVVWLRAP